MADFRMMPKQCPPPKVSSTYYGFVIDNHPLGDPSHGGRYIASWSTWELAVMAAYSLGMTENDVQYVGRLVPELELPLHG